MQRRRQAEAAGRHAHLPRAPPVLPAAAPLRDSSDWRRPPPHPPPSRLPARASAHASAHPPVDAPLPQTTPAAPSTRRAWWPRCPSSCLGRALPSPTASSGACAARPWGPRCTGARVPGAAGGGSGARARRERLLLPAWWPRASGWQAPPAGMRDRLFPDVCRGYLEVMLDRVFGESALHLNAKLEKAAASGAPGGCGSARRRAPQPGTAWRLLPCAGARMVAPSSGTRASAPQRPRRATCPPAHSTQARRSTWRRASAS